MSIRRLIVEIDPASLNVTEFCRSHGVSTWFFWDLRRRHRIEGDVVLETRSRAPRRVANKTSLEVEDEVVRTRKHLVDVGLDAGPASIQFALRDLPGVPSESTIWRILSARGLITPDPTKAPKRSRRRFTADRANECWQLDHTSWVLGDGTEVKILNIVDDHSRLLVASVATVSGTGAHTLEVFAQVAAVLGWPERFLSDNAKAFRYVLADALAALGIAAGHSRPYHPQTCGKVERFHQTLKRWLTQQPSATGVAELQAQLDIFRHIYNHHRPHRSLTRQFPATVWELAPKSGPANRPIGQPTIVSTGIVANSRVNAGGYTITIPGTYNGCRALTAITGTTCHVFTDGNLTRHFTIDPNRRTQTIYDRPGKPPTVREDPRHP